MSGLPTTLKRQNINELVCITDRIKSPAKAAPIRPYLPKLLSAVTPLGGNTLSTWSPTTNGSPTGRVIIMCSVSPWSQDEPGGSSTQVLSPSAAIYFMESNPAPGFARLDAARQRPGIDHEEGVYARHTRLGRAL